MAEVIVCRKIFVFFLLEKKIFNAKTEYQRSTIFQLHESAVQTAYLRYELFWGFFFGQPGKVDIHWEPENSL